MIVRIGACAVGCLLFALGGCGGLPKPLGNDKGGMIDWFGTNESQVFAAAQKHCGSFGKSAKITAIRKEAGGSVLFDCL